MYLLKFVLFMSLKISMVALTFFLFTLVDNFEIYIENENSNQFITMKMVKNEFYSMKDHHQV